MATKKHERKILGLGIDAVKEYASFFSDKNIASLHIKEGEYEVELKKESSIPIAAAQPIASAAPAVALASAPHEAPAAPFSEESDSAVDDGNYEKVNSPIMGTFYSSPSPESPVYVKEGDTVTPDTVVCIVEAMKMMNELKAGVKGTVKKILASDADPVSAGQTLFLIEKG